MTASEPFGALRGLLGALDGVAYVTDADGVVVAAGEPGWSEFGAAAAAGPPPLGRSVFDQMCGEEVRKVWRRIYRAVVQEHRRVVAFECRCDGPDIRRTLRIAVSALPRAQRGPLLLHQALVLSAVERPWMSLFEPDRIVEVVGAERRYPVVRLCTFCHKVAEPEAKAASDWIEPETYYHRGGPSEVRVSHGVCPSCTGIG